MTKPTTEVLTTERIADVVSRLRLHSGERQFLVTEKTALEAADVIELLASRTSPATEAVAWVHNLTKIVRFDKPYIGMAEGDYTPLYATPQPVAVKVTDEMVERLARYMAQDNGVPPDEPLYVGSETLAWHAWVEDARAALAALSSGDAS